MKSQNFPHPSKGKSLDDYIASNLSKFFPNLKLINLNERVANKSTFDIHARDSNGTDYYIEIKESKCNRLSIGQIVEYKASLSHFNPQAKIILICKDINTELRETLKKINIDVKTFADLGIPREKADHQVSITGAVRLSPVEQKAYFALLRRGYIVAKAEDLALTLNVSYPWAKNILSKLANHGAAQRIGKGKYAVIPADVLYGRKSYVADPLFLVAELMKGIDYYVAYDSAAHVHGIIEQMSFKTTVAVLKQLRPIKIGNINVNFTKIKKQKFFGYKEAKYGDTNLKVSDIEKTILDCVDRQELCGGIAEVIRTISNASEAEKIDWQKLISYVKKLGSRALAQRLGFIIELLKERKKIQVDNKILDDLESLTGPKLYPLDVKAPKQGNISTKWRIINNAGFLEI